MTRIYVGTFKLKEDKNGEEIVASKYPLYFMDEPSAFERVRPSESRGGILEYGYNLLKVD